MKLTQNKIDEIVLEILGPEGLRLVKELKNKKNISEFALAKKLKRDIKLVRNMLYKLSSYNLVLSTRKKDKQKGWYIYYWTVLQDNLKFLYLKNKRMLLQQLKEQLERNQTEQFFTCPTHCVRLDFDQAIDFEFRCPECGELVSQDLDPNRIPDLQKKIEELEKEFQSEEKAMAKLKTIKIKKKEPSSKKIKKLTKKKK